MKRLINWVAALCCMIVTIPQTKACQCFHVPRNIVDAVQYRLQAGENAAGIYVLKVKIVDTFSTNWSGINSTAFKLKVLHQYSGGTVLNDTVTLCNTNGGLCYGGVIFTTLGDTVVLDCTAHASDSIDNTICNFNTKLHNDTICNNYLVQTPDTVYAYSSCYPVSSLTDSLNHILQTLGVDQLAIEEGINVYPNPTSDYISLNLEHHVTVLSVQLTDISGKVIRSYGAASKLDVQGIARGLYYLRVGTARGNVTKKIVIQ